MRTICRLFGISYGDKGQEEIPTSEIAATLFYLLVKGGPHAYGWMSYNEDRDEINWAKTPGRADSNEAMDWFADEIDNEARWFVGHTRYATDGDPSDNRNNHPIWHGEVVGVHNGVLSDWEPILAETGREDEGAEVDSEAIFAAVEKWGTVEGLKKIRGSAVTLFSRLSAPDVVCLARTSGRSVTLGWTDRGNMIWASEESALLSLEYWGIKFVKVSKVSENRLLLIKNGDIIHRVRFRPIEKKVVAPFDWSKWDNYKWGDDLKPSPATVLPDNDDDWYIASQMLRAERRGRRMKRNKLRNADGSRHLIFYQGQYVTEDEFEEIRNAQKP